MRRTLSARPSLSDRSLLCRSQFTLPGNTTRCDTLPCWSLRPRIVGVFSSPSSQMFFSYNQARSSPEPQKTHRKLSGKYAQQHSDFVPSSTNEDLDSTNIEILRKEEPEVASVDNAHQQKEHFFDRSTSFSQLGIDAKLVEALKRNGILIPAKIQAKTIPLVLAGEDVVIGAETGSGKTLAYLLPILQNLLREKPTNLDKESRMPRAVVMLPNKELCEQVKKVVDSLVPSSRLLTGLLLTKDGLYGRRPDLIICTPVALKAVLDSSPEYVPSLKYIVVDEADMMLSGGFYDSVNLILAGCKKRSRTDKEKSKAIRASIKQTSDPQELEKLKEELRKYTLKKQFVFSAATIPKERNNKSAMAFLEVHFEHAKRAEINLHHTLPTVTQDWILLDEIENSYERLVALIKGKEAELGEKAQTIIFTNSMHTAELTNMMLNKADIQSIVYHGHLAKDIAADNLKRFIKGEARYLVATNLLSRGLDFVNVRHIIQFEFASNKIEHLHRIGRTARGGDKGIVTNFYTDTDSRLVNEIRTADGEAMQQTLVFKADWRRIDMRKEKLKNRKKSRSFRRSSATRGSGGQQDEDEDDEGHGDVEGFVLDKKDRRDRKENRRDEEREGSYRTRREPREMRPTGDKARMTNEKRREGFKKPHDRSKEQSSRTPEGRFRERDNLRQHDNKEGFIKRKESNNKPTQLKNKA